MSAPQLSKGTHDYTSIPTLFMALPRRSFLSIISVPVFLFICMGLFTLRNHDVIVGNGPHQVEKVEAKHQTNVFDVKNATLGFSKVFVIGMEERSDKRDSVALAASFSGIDFEWVNGVRGADIPIKSHPLGWNEQESNTTLGCWRAHMDVAQRIVKEGISSALVLEDDADWDVMLKEQLVELSRGARFLQGDENPDSEVTGDSPYGDDWDLLWIGHCGAKNRVNQDSKYWVIQDDPTAIPEKLWQNRRRLPNLNTTLLSGNNTRAVFETSHALCTTGYAISFRGAQKLLYHQSVLGKAEPSDRALLAVCRERYMGMQCFAPYPALVQAHKAAGPTAKDSDRIGLAGGYREVSQSLFLVFPTRVNIERLMVDKNERIPSQYPADTMLTEIDRKMELPRGHGVFIRKGEYGWGEEEKWKAAHPGLTVERD